MVAAALTVAGPAVSASMVREEEHVGHRRTRASAGWGRDRMAMPPPLRIDCFDKQIPQSIPQYFQTRPARANATNTNDAA